MGAGCGESRYAGKGVLAMSSRFRTGVALLSSWVVVGVFASLAPVSASAAVSIPGGFTSLSPSRLLDTRAGYLTVYGDGITRPTASNLNFIPAQTVPNLVIAPVGTNGKVALYNGSTGTVQLVADVSGYYVAGAPSVAGAFGSLAPPRS